MKKLYIFLIALFALNGAMAQWFPQNSGTTKNLNSVYFTDVNNGYAVGDSGTIIKTIDAGTTWNALSSGTTKKLHSVFFPDASNGYAVGDSGTILKTVNAGTAWTSLASGTIFSLTSVFFTDDNRGYAVGYDNWSSNHYIILKTTNSGTIWTTSLADTGFLLNSVYFTNATTGYIAGYNFNANPQAKLFLKTIDSGATWTSSTSGVNSCELQSVFFATPDTGYAVGLAQTFAKTTDAGASWITTYECVIDSPHLYSVCFTDALTGYAVGAYTHFSSFSGRVYKTNNGGILWTDNFSLSDFAFTSVFFTGVDTGYIAGTGGVILKTTNGGGYPAGVNNQTPSSNLLKIYPNPSSDKIIVETSFKGQLSILNINGQEIITRQITEPNTNLDISNLPCGVYFVRLTGERTVEVGKIIKEK